LNPPAPRPLSRVIVELGQTAGARVSLQELTEALSDRSFAALIILFAAPNLLPLPPGSSTFFGIPLILIASQLLLGRPRLWLPRLLRERSLDQATFARLTTRMEPVLQRFERLARPRYWPLPQVMAERFVGFVVLLMALVLVFPIPFGNWTPAVAAILVSLGLSERDGVWLGIGTLVAAGSLGLAGGIVGSIGYAANGLF
jgi:hypothetical protein